jgi:hypothetical protein
MYRYVYLKETSWRMWEVGGSVVLKAFKGICRVEPSGSNVGYFIYTKNEQSTKCIQLWCSTGWV